MGGAGSFLVKNSCTQRNKVVNTFSKSLPNKVTDDDDDDDGRFTLHTGVGLVVYDIRLLVPGIKYQHW